MKINKKTGFEIAERHLHPVHRKGLRNDFILLVQKT